MKYIKDNNDGQSLMELLIAITILVVALVATIALIINSIEAGRASRDKLIGTNFAREGIEIVRNIRDSNWIDPDEATAWDDGLDLSIAAPVFSHEWNTEPTGLIGITGFGDAGATIWYSLSKKMNLQEALATLPLDKELTSFYRVIYLSLICHDSVGTEKIVAKESTDDCTSFPDEDDGPFGQVGIQVIAEVRWPTSDSNHKVVIEERLYNWQAL